jgi:hypothetical protein
MQRIVSYRSIFSQESKSTRQHNDTSTLDNRTSNKDADNLKPTKYQLKNWSQKEKITLKREPMEENLDDFDDSSGSGGNRPATKGQFEAVNRAWCSATT